MRRLVCGVTLAGCLVMAAGCVTYEQKIEFKKDGSGELTVDIWLDYTFYEMGCKGQEDLGPGLAKLEGVKVKKNWTKMEGEPGNRRAHTKVVAKFDKVERLNGGDWFGEQVLSFKAEGNEFAYSHSVSSEDDDGEDTWGLSGEGGDFARALFGDIVLNYAVKMPGRVTETNGKINKDGRTVTWDYGFDVGGEVSGFARMTATSRK